MQSASSIVIEPGEATLMSIGATVQLSATVLDANGQPVGDALLSWESSDESVAMVSGQGLVTAVNGCHGPVRQCIANVTVSQTTSIVIEPGEATLMSIGETVCN